MEVSGLLRGIEEVVGHSHQSESAETVLFRHSLQLLSLLLNVLHKISSIALVQFVRRGHALVPLVPGNAVSVQAKSHRPLPLIGVPGLADQIMDGLRDSPDAGALQRAEGASVPHALPLHHDMVRDRIRFVICH